MNLNTPQKSLDLLDPALKPIAENFLATCKAKGLNVIIVETFRSNERQNFLYSIGRDEKGNKIGRTVTRAKAGESKHNFGKAFDIACIYGGKYAPDSHPAWKSAGIIGESLGLVWYGNPRAKFFELAHFELKE